MTKIKRVKLLFFFCAIMLFMVSCNSQNENIVSFSSDDIYLECTNYDDIINGLPEELLILESAEQLEYVLDNYEAITSLSEFRMLMDEYPIFEYTYILQYFETAYGNKVSCKKLNINTVEMTIDFEHKIKGAHKDGPAAITTYITYAVLPKEYLSDYDFSNQKGVLYLGK